MDRPDISSPGFSGIESQLDRTAVLGDFGATVEAESTAWATQLRMLAARLLKSIAAEVGHNVV